MKGDERAESGTEGTHTEVGIGEEEENGRREIDQGKGEEMV